MATYQSVILAKRPGKGEIVPGETFKIEEHKRLEESDLKDGQLLLEVVYLSLDPSMRGWLNDVITYVPPVPVGGRMRGPVIAEVTASKSGKYEVGCFVYAAAGWTEQAIVDESDKVLQKLDVAKGGRLSDGLGVFGTSGLTAYFGILEVGKVKAGDFVVVSGAAGAVGSIVGQIAKLKGARVLGLAGSDDKVEWLKELGFDDALNYKDPEFTSKFIDATKDKIDIYFDNVGGDILDLAFTRAKPFSTFVICGAISQYNSATPSGPKNWSMIIVSRIHVQGFICFDFEDQYSAARKQLAQWLAEGKIQRRETVLKGGLKAAEQGLIDLYRGINTGKLLLEIRPEDKTGSNV